MKALAILPVLALSACVVPTTQDITRNAAKSTVNRVVVSRFPGLPVEPSINCIVDNATQGEILGLASDSVTGPTEATIQTVFSIIRRPATVQCLATRGVPALLN
ncbi:hypothetical protein PARPLA_02151 [Rhodobacteraceae bacterium THAF1]|nr:hypothetical protein FIU81_04160 [Palleronia sp. THAF1]VDC25697.1 hypothetical protein PARPLA_02151 [Rhodobacteraceae bacterium THAF1]